MSTFSIGRRKPTTHILQDKAVHNGLSMLETQAWIGKAYVCPTVLVKDLLTRLVASFFVQGILLELWGTFNSEDGIPLLERRSDGGYEQ